MAVANQGRFFRMKFLKLSLVYSDNSLIDDDTKRVKSILDIFVTSVICLLSFALLIHAVNYVFFSNDISWANSALSFTLVFAFLAFFISLLVLSRRGSVRLASYLLVGALFLIATYLGFRWGVDAHASLFFFIVVIVMAGVLISTKVAFQAVSLVALTMLLLGYLQTTGITQPNLYWKFTDVRMTDVVMFITVFLIINTVLWLSNREIESSLKRARKSEAELKTERDQLEVRVKERTEELRQAEMEKLAQTYRFVEFGRLASGLFHDLMNPLTALSLNLENIAGSKQEINVGRLSDDIDRAKHTTAHMQRLMDGMRKHLSSEGGRTEFVIEDTLREVVHVLETYARMRQVRLSLQASGRTVVMGDPVHFTQIITNLISNAVESYDLPAAGETVRWMVEIEVTCDAQACAVKVVDQGRGIAPADQERIFEPFITTKQSEGGFGLGLSLARRMVEREFGGTITVNSTVGQGTTFVVHLPL